MSKAVRFDHYGGRDVLYIAEVDVPDPAAGEVVVQVKAAGVNPGEAAIREGRLSTRGLENREVGSSGSLRAAV